MLNKIEKLRGTSNKMSSAVASNEKKKKFSVLDYSIYLILLGLIVYFSISSPVFLSRANIGNFFSQIPAVGILTLALTMVLITGAVDLSIASNLAFSGTLAVMMAANGLPPIVVIPATLAVGAFWGFVNGFFVTKFNLAPFILTLGTSFVIRGIILFLTNGVNVAGVPEWFFRISNTRFLGGYFSSNTVIFIILCVVFAFILKKTRFGRYCYAVGTNKEAARLSGIKTDQHVIKVYVLAGIMASIAGILVMSNLNIGAPAEGEGMDLLALASSVIGGSRFGGGVGTIGGAVVGVFTIQVFANGLAIMGVNTFMQSVVTGLIIVAAVTMDYFRRKQN